VALRLLKDGQVVLSWLMVAASLWLPMLVVSLLFRGARPGLRSLLGDEPARRITTVSLWACTLLLFEAVFGAALRATTHHHALAGVTYAVGTAVVGTVLFAMAQRVSSATWSLPPSARDPVLGIQLSVMGAFLVFGLSKVFGSSLAGAGMRGDLPLPLLMDALAFGFSAAALGLDTSPPRKRLSAFGPALALLLFGAGLGLHKKDGSLASRLRESSLLFRPSVVLLYGGGPGPATTRESSPDEPGPQEH
jgi:hypothetical protein